jgi:hypothetical protein
LIFRIGGVTGSSNSHVTEASNGCVITPDGAIPADPRHTVSQKKSDSANAGALPHRRFLAAIFQGNSMSTIHRNRLYGLGRFPCLGSSSRWRFRARPAQQVAENDSDAIETVVVTGHGLQYRFAPAKASLETTEPQTIINQSYIQDSTANTADYTTILAIAPSMSGQDINGPGLSDGNVKNTLRGLPDGNFAMQYDGIPFGDTNGPSHHSESYFPGVTIGTIDVDRGPGNAGNMGSPRPMAARSNCFPKR